MKSMLLVLIGSVLIIVGVAVTAVRTARRGRLSSPAPNSEHPDTLEPQGRGDRLSLFSDLPGIALVALGAVVLLLWAVI